MTDLPRPVLCLVTDRRALDPSARTPAREIASLEEHIDAAVDAGIDLLHIREAGLPARALLQLAVRAVARAATTRTRIVLNDRADIASSAECGVHLKSDGPIPADVRPLIRTPQLIGCSMHEPVAARRVVGADYAVFGTVYPSASKPAGAVNVGIDGLRRACSEVSVPVLAIGGITPARVAECRRAGAAGIAAIGLFLPAGRAPGSMGPAAAVAALREAWDKVIPRADE